MPKLILLRHFQSQWNLENRFTGWVDVPLSKKRGKEAKKVGKLLAKFKIDVIFTSPLIRNQDTVLRILEYFKKYPIFIHFSGKMQKFAHFKELNKNYLPVFVSEKLNERYYGKLQGLDKEKTMKKYGKDQVHLWRRSYELAPPGGESLKDVVNRTIPFYKKYIEKTLKKGNNVLVVASHNSLRALVKHIEKISDKDIINLEIRVGTLIEYQFDKSITRAKRRVEGDESKLSSSPFAGRSGDEGKLRAMKINLHLPPSPPFGSLA